MPVESPRTSSLPTASSLLRHGETGQCHQSNSKRLFHTDLDTHCQPPRLLPELLPLVFKDLDEDELRSVALVCKEWTAAAQAELFRVIATDYWEVIERYNRHFAAHPKLGSLVKEIRVIIEAEFQNPNSVGVSHDQLATMLSLTPEVRILKLGNLISLGDTERKMMAGLKRVEELSLFCSNLNYVDKYEIGAFAEMLSHWTQLRKVTLRSVQFHKSKGIPSIPPPSFSTLNLFGSRFFDDELSWLLSESQGSLRSFEYVELKEVGDDLGGMLARLFGGGQAAPSAQVTASGLVTLVGQVGSSLSSLHLGVESLRPIHIASMLSKTPQLVSLAIPLISIDPTALSSAPRSLRRLQLYLMPKSSLVTPEATEAAVSSLKQADFRSLEKLVVSSIYGGGAYPRFEDDLREIAESTGVSIWFHDRHFHYW